MEVPGFNAGAVVSEMRYKGRLDLGLIVADELVAAAGVFTRNRVKAAPVIWSAENLSSGRARAVLVNAGQANACTGPEGKVAAEATARSVAGILACEPNQVLLASTGVIGQPLNMPAFEMALPNLAGALRRDGLEDVARAMMTTDTIMKTSRVTGQIDGVTFTVAGMAKGSGMIAPNMATMLCIVLTDAAVSPTFMKSALKKAADGSFNKITVDGDTSTNDCILALASGKAGNAEVSDESSPGAAQFEAALNAALFVLAKMVVADGEGATKLVAVRVSGAADEAQARSAAMTVANSPLVKTALFGQDPNWGRILAALGRSEAEFDPERVSIDLDDTPLVREGRFAGDEPAAAAVMKQKEFAINIRLNAGAAEADVLTCDFSYDYVKINADYRS